MSEWVSERARCDCFCSSVSQAVIRASAPLSAWLHLWEMTPHLMLNCTPTHTHTPYMHTQHILMSFVPNSPGTARSHAALLYPQILLIEGDWQQPYYLHPTSLLSLLPYTSLIKTFAESSCIILIKPKGILSKFPYKGPNWTSSSLQLNTCWVSCLSGGLRLKQNRPRKTPPPLPNICRNTHVQTHKSKLFTSTCAKICASYVSLQRRYMHLYKGLFSPTRGKPLTVRHGWERSVLSCQLSFCSLLLLLNLCLLVFAAQIL